jgi:cell division protein FtsL
MKGWIAIVLLLLTNYFIGSHLMLNRNLPVALLLLLASAVAITALIRFHERDLIKESAEDARQE